jgi:hypothetical protein
MSYLNNHRSCLFNYKIIILDLIELFYTVKIFLLNKLLLRLRFFGIIFIISMSYFNSKKKSIGKNQLLLYCY